MNTLNGWCEAIAYLHKQGEAAQKAELEKLARSMSGARIVCCDGLKANDFVILVGPDLYEAIKSVRVELSSDE